MPIHSTAVVHASAELDPSAEVGPYAVIEAGVRIGPQTRIYAHAYVSEGARLGARVQVHPFAIVSHPPQDLKYDGAPSYTVVGDDTIIREYVAVHRPTTPEGTTRIGARCFLMSTSHVGHDCVVEDDVIMASGALLAGHVHVQRGAFLSGHTAVHQFSRIGERAMISGLARAHRDVPPFMTLAPHAVVTGPNVVGLRRAGFSSEERQEIREAYKLLYRSRLPWKDAIQRAIAHLRTDAGLRLAAFLAAPSKRGYCTYRPAALADQSTADG